MAAPGRQLEAQPLATSLFPMFVKLHGKNVLVVGAGNIGEPKIRALLDTGAHIRVVAFEATETVREWSCAGLLADAWCLSSKSGASAPAAQGSPATAKP